MDEGIYLIGGNNNQHTNLHYTMQTIKVKANMIHEKSFFCAVYCNGKIYTFGGYDAYLKVQLPGCEYYDIKLDKWFNSPVPNSGKLDYKLHQERS